jgi:phage-related protein
MWEYGAVWTVTAPDGASVTFNDGLGLYLEDVSGFDSPNVRENVEDLPGVDGAVAGNFWYGSRPVTLTGRIVASSASARNTKISDLLIALRGLRGNVILQTTPSGMSAMRATGRIQNVRITGGFVKQFQIGIVCPDPRMYGTTLNSQSSSGTTLSVTNAGNFDAPPVLRITNYTNPVITNTTSGEAISFTGLTLGTTAYVDVDMLNKTIVSDLGVNRYANVVFPASKFWFLRRGSNSLSFTGGGGSKSVRVQWYDVWV